jgi:hypothetical protein
MYYQKKDISTCMLVAYSITWLATWFNVWKNSTWKWFIKIETCRANQVYLVVVTEKHWMYWCSILSENMFFQLSLSVSVKNLYLTDSTQQSNSWKAKIHSAGWHPSQSLKILCHMKPAHIFENYINIILPSMPSSLKFLFPFRISYDNFLIHFSSTSCMPHALPSHPPDFISLKTIHSSL